MLEDENRHLISRLKDARNSIDSWIGQDKERYIQARVLEEECAHARAAVKDANLTIAELKAKLYDNGICG